MKDLIRVRVTDAAEQGWISERSLECVILPHQLLSERLLIDFEWLNASTVDLCQRLFASNYCDRCTTLRTGLSEQQSAILEIESCETETTGNLCTRLEPSKAAGDHEMYHDPEIVIQADRDSLSNSPHITNGFPFYLSNRWID
jgi:hypothetical protein